MVSYNLKVILSPLNEIRYDETYEKLSNLISLAMLGNQELKNLHKENKYKLYSFCSLYPYQKSGIYSVENIYQFDIRSLNLDFCLKIKQLLMNVKSKDFKVIMINLQTNKQRKINKLISLTPSIITTQEKGYKIDNDLELVKNRIIAGAEKKYKQIYGTEISHDFVDHILQTNIKPIKIPYKSIFLLGNKFEVIIKEDSLSQELAYVLFATGILEKNSLGFGFCRAN